MIIKLDFEQRQRAGELADEMASADDFDQYAFELISLRDELSRMGQPAGTPGNCATHNRPVCEMCTQASEFKPAGTPPQPPATPQVEAIARAAEEIIAICGTFVPNGWEHPGNRCVVLIEEVLAGLSKHLAGAPPACTCNPKPLNGEHWTGCPGAPPERGVE